jgi:hypothetical protein
MVPMSASSAQYCTGEASPSRQLPQLPLTLTSSVVRKKEGLPRINPTWAVCIQAFLRHLGQC